MHIAKHPEDSQDNNNVLPSGNGREKLGNGWQTTVRFSSTPMSSKRRIIDDNDKISPVLP